MEYNVNSTVFAENIKNPQNTIRNTVITVMKMLDL